MTAAIASVIQNAFQTPTAPKNLLAKSDNPNESKLVFANQSKDGSRTPNMSTQELPPAMKSFYSNSYLITKSAGDLDYDSCNAALFAEKPTTVSLGYARRFWHFFLKSELPGLGPIVNGGDSCEN